MFAVTPIETEFPLYKLQFALGTTVFSCEKLQACEIRFNLTKYQLSTVEESRSGRPVLTQASVTQNQPSTTNGRGDLKGNEEQSCEIATATGVLAR